MSIAPFGEMGSGIMTVGDCRKPGPEPDGAGGPETSEVDKPGIGCNIETVGRCRRRPKRQSIRAKRGGRRAVASVILSPGTVRQPGDGSLT